MDNTESLNISSSALLPGSSGLRPHKLHLAPLALASNGSRGNDNNDLAKGGSSGCVAATAEANDKVCCYLSSQTGQIDRLNLVLPLNKSEQQCASNGNSVNSLSMLSTSPPFSSHAMTKNDLDYCSDTDRTPVNCEKGFLFSPTFSSTRSSTLSSCRSADSGTESICSESVEDYLSDMSTDRILKFFAADKSKSNRLAARRQTSGNIRHASTDDDNDDDDDEELFSDESTLSESSLSPHEYTATQSLITPESVVAAIDKKIKQHQQECEQKSRNNIANSENSNSDNEIVVGKLNNLSTGSDTIDVKQQTNFPKFNSQSSEVQVIIDKSTIDAEQDDDDEIDDDEDYSRRIPLLRSTSLKTGKTPPGTPGAKKIVRFADALGLDLESVRHIVDDVPYVPPLAAFKGLKLDDEDKNWIFGQSPTIQHTTLLNPLLNPLPSSASNPNLCMLFGQPSSDPGPFLERVRLHKVCLENCLVTGPSGPTDMFTITCIVRVLNVGFEKSVMLRYTTNEWLTWTDVLASYVPNSCDGFSDKFTVTFHLAVNSNGHQTMMPGQRLLFAIKYIANANQEYWDNNMGLNYQLIYQRG